MQAFHRFALLTVVLTFFVACQSDDGAVTVSVTAPVAPTRAATVAAAASPTALEPSAAATAVPAQPDSTAESEAAEPVVSTSTPVPAATSTIAAAPLTAVQLVPVTGNFDEPTYLGHAFDRRLFVVEKAGRIQIVDEEGRRAEPFLDIMDRVGSGGSEQGLLSVAFHPEYGNNGLFYVNYTNRNGDTVVSRFQVGEAPDRADPAGEQILLTIGQPYQNHNGGQLQFGPDGYLYVGMGDGGSGGDPQNHGQNPATLLGALLRLDVDAGGEAGYAIPPDNPYVGSDTGRNEVWAIGLRNPWRFSFDRETGDLYIADVGQNQYEEVNVAPAGHPAPINYGWNIMEGLHCYGSDSCDQEGLYLPAVEYSHPEGGCSITGGYVYRGEQFPALSGNYFYGDFCTGRVWSFLPPDGEPRQVASVQGNITSFGQDAMGELYLLTQQGQVYQIQP